MFSEKIFSEVYDLFTVGPSGKNYTDIHELVLTSIKKLLLELKKHDNGHDFYIEKEFEFLKSLLPKEVTYKEFHSLYYSCLKARLSYSEFIEPKDHKLVEDDKRFFNERRKLDSEPGEDVAEDIYGASYRLLPVLTETKSYKRHQR